MPDNAFTTAMNAADAQFAKVAGETFEVVKTGNLGTYDAISIDDLTASSSVVAGGLRGENTVAVWVTRSVLSLSAITDGSVLKVRNKRVRVATISDQGDDGIMLQCASAGMQVSGGVQVRR